MYILNSDVLIRCQNPRRSLKLLPFGRLIEFSQLSAVKGEEDVEAQMGVEPEPHVDSALKPVSVSLLDQLVKCQECKYIKTWTKEDRQSGS